MHRTSRRRGPAVALSAALLTTLAILPTPPAGAIVTTIPITSRISTGTGGGQAPTGSWIDFAIDGSGRYAFFDTASPLVAADTNGKVDTYRKDRLTGTTQRVSLLATSTQASVDAVVCDVTTDGRYVGFWLNSGGFLPSATNLQLFLRDLETGTTDLVTQADGQPADAAPSQFACSISADGDRVAFSSRATNLGGPSDGTEAVYLRRRAADATTLISRSSSGSSADADASQPTVSATGDVVAFTSSATNLGGGADADGDLDVFVRVVSQGTTTRASTTAAGTAVQGISQSPSISADGRYVLFSSTATNLVADDGNGVADAFRKDRQSGAVLRASVTTAGIEATKGSSGLDLSADGRYAAFTTDAMLYAADVNGIDDVYRHDFTLARTDLVSRVSGSIAAGNKQSGYGGRLSADGRVVAFCSYASDLVPGDTNGTYDVFVRDFALDLAPFGSAKAFATQQLADFAAAVALPTPAAVDAATAGLVTGQTSPDALIVQQGRATAWSAKRGPLVRLYWAFFLRAPDPSGMTYWTNQLTGGKALAQVAAQFALSSEFQAKYGSKTDEQFVTLIYQNIFERDPDAGGLAFWTNKLATKQKTRGDVMVNFSESSEGKRVLAPQADTVLITLGMLRTMPTKAVILDQKAKRAAGHVAEEYAAALRAQGAYAARITP